MSLSQKIKELLIFSNRKEERVLDAIFRSSFLNLIARIFGYAKHLSIAVIMGFNYQTDGFFMALSLIGIFLIFADVFDSIGIPQLVRAKSEAEQEFKKLAGLFMTFTALLSIVNPLLALLLKPLILKIPSGFSEVALTHLESSYIMLIPYLFLSFYFHHFGAILRSRRRFTAYFVGELIFSLSNFLLLTVGLFTTKDPMVIPLSFSLSQLFATLYMLYVGRQFIHFRFYVDQNTKKILNHFFQLSILYGVFHLYILVDRAFASYLDEKAISALTYGLLIASSPKGVLKLEHIAITSLAEAGGSTEKLNFYSLRVLLLVLPIALTFFILSDYIAKLLFGYGAFSHVDIELTGEALRFYSLSLPFMFLWPLLYRVFQIRENLKVVSVISTVGVVVNGALNYLFVFILKLGIAGVCLGTAFAYFVICSLGYAMLLKDRKS